MSKKIETRVYELLGRATGAWNRIELIWYLIFVALMKPTWRPKIDAIYNYLTTFSSQRQLTLTVADAGLHHKSDLRKRIGQLNARINDLAGRRNAAVHALSSVGKDGTITAIQLINRKKPNRFAGKSLEPELSALIIEAQELADDLVVFRNDLLKGLSSVSPRTKPEPPSLK